MVLQSLEQAENELAEFLGKMSDQEVCAAFNAAKRDAEPVLIRLILSAEIVNRNLEDELKNCDCSKYEQVGPVPNYCRVHDGDYSDFLVFNNCD